MNYSMFDIAEDKKATDMHLKILNNRISYLNISEKRVNIKFALAK